MQILVIFRNPKDTAVSFYHFSNNNPVLPSGQSWDAFFSDFMSGDGEKKHAGIPPCCIAHTSQPFFPIPRLSCVYGLINRVSGGFGIPLNPSGAKEGREAPQAFMGQQRAVCQRDVLKSVHGLKAESSKRHQMQESWTVSATSLCSVSPHL